MRFAVGSSATLRRSYAWRIERIQEVHVHRYMESGCISRGNLDGFHNDLCHAPLIHLAHCVDPYAERFDHLALSGIDAASAYDDCVLRQDFGRESTNASQLGGSPPQ